MDNLWEYLLTIQDTNEIENGKIWGEQNEDIMSYNNANS